MKRIASTCSPRLRQLAALLLVAVAEALAQESEDHRTRERRIVVSIPDRKLALLEAGRVVKIYPAAVGKPSTPSPTGSFTITGRLANPTWWHPGKVVGPGRRNPLGTRWMSLSRKGFGIHGTSSPSSIGQAASHGCIRLRNHDVEELFELVSVGDAVELHDQRDAETARIFGPLLVASAAGVQ